MRYFSDVTRKFYESEKEALEAEQAHEREQVEAAEKAAKLAEERKASAKKVEDAYRAVIEAQTEYNKLRREFIDKYGSFHMTFSTKDGDLFTNLFDRFFCF